MSTDPPTGRTCPRKRTARHWLSTRRLSQPIYVGALVPDSRSVSRPVLVQIVLNIVKSADAARQQTASDMYHPLAARTLHGVRADSSRIEHEMKGSESCCAPREVVPKSVTQLPILD